MPYANVSEKHSISTKAIFDRKGSAAFATKVVTATPTHFDSSNRHTFQYGSKRQSAQTWDFCSQYCTLLTATDHTSKFLYLCLGFTLNDKKKKEKEKERNSWPTQFQSSFTRISKSITRVWHSFLPHVN